MGYRYIGSKTRVLGSLLKCIGNIVGKSARIADLMCGTSTVAAALREHGYSVIANDLMTYSYHHARVSLLFTEIPQFRNAQSFIDEFRPNIEGQLFPSSAYEQILQSLQNVPPVKGYFWREFSEAGHPRNASLPRNYFSPENAKKIDGIRKWLLKLSQLKMLTALEHSLLLHDLIMGANDIANIAGTYGHYMAHISGRAKDPIRLTPTQLLIKKDAGKHRVLKGYAEQVAKTISCDLCYIDPPYMKRQYAANYHILESLAREDEPEAIGASGLRPWRDQYSNFCTKTKIHDSFREILNTMKCKHFLISYSEDGLLSLNELKRLFLEFGKVKVTNLRLNRFRSNNSNLAPILTEYLFYIEKV